MAEKLGDGGYWLPPEFLSEDDLLMDFKAESFRVKGGDGFLYGLGSGSDLCSPVESVTGSSEAENEENDFIAFLSSKIGFSTSHETKASSDYQTKGWNRCGSPQSTLYGCKPCSSRTSPIYFSGLSSTPEAKKKMEWDLIYAAAEEVARMRVNEQTAAYHHPPKAFTHSSKPCTANFTRINPSAASEFYSNQRMQPQFSYEQFRAIQLQQIRGGTWNFGTNDPFHNGKCESTPVSSTAAWPTTLQSQQQPKMIPSSGMRAVFLPENGAKKVRTGTGVFLPRRYGANATQSETNQKPGCSPVLLPDRVVHALNLNLDSIDIPTPALSRSNANFPPQYEAALKHGANPMMAQKMRNLKPQPGLNQDIWLPPEWTY